MALLPNADFRFRCGLPPSHLRFLTPFRFLILHPSISVCTQFHRLFFGRPLSLFSWGLLLNGPGIDSAPSENEYHERFLGYMRPVHEADNLTTFMYRMS
jgi:hypothetical protein